MVVLVIRDLRGEERGQRCGLRGSVPGQRGVIYNTLSEGIGEGSEIMGQRCVSIPTITTGSFVICTVLTAKGLFLTKLMFLVCC